MKLPDHTLVVSAIIRLAERDGQDQVSPGAIVSYISQEIGVQMPLHTVSSIISDLGVITRPRQNRQYVIWNEERMTNLKQTYVDGYVASITTNKTEL